MMVGQPSVWSTMFRPASNCWKLWWQMRWLVWKSSTGNCSNHSTCFVRINPYRIFRNWPIAKSDKIAVAAKEYSKYFSNGFMMRLQQIKAITNGQTSWNSERNSLKVPWGQQGCSQKHVHRRDSESPSGENLRNTKSDLMAVQFHIIYRGPWPCESIGRMRPWKFRFMFCMESWGYCFPWPAENIFLNLFIKNIVYNPSALFLLQIVY